jgi:hypothetical protein
MMFTFSFFLEVKHIFVLLHGGLFFFRLFLIFVAGSFAIFDDHDALVVESDFVFVLLHLLLCFDALSLLFLEVELLFL